jgi:xanthine dehydrogenase accessory factor
VASVGSLGSIRPGRSKISAIVLAAGGSTRMGTPKPLVLINGRPLLDYVLRMVRGSHIDDIVVVLGPEADRVRQAISVDRARTIVNDAYQEGMSTSIRAGVRAADPRSDGLLIVLGDQPFVASKTLDDLIARRDESHAKILIPTYEGHRGNPVLLDRSLSSEVQEITGDQGCRAIFGRHRDGILEVPVDDPGILVDLDTPEQISRAEDAVRSGHPIQTLVSLTHGQGDEAPSISPRLDVFALAQQFRSKNEPFVLATVVRVERPSSGRPGFKAIVRPDRQLIGWLGGSCAESVLVSESLRSLRDGHPRLIRITPTPGRGPPEEGLEEFVMECASGGTMDIYLEPHPPHPTLLVVGDSPVAKALMAIARVLDYRIVHVTTEAGSAGLDADRVISDLKEIPGAVTPDTYVVVATMGKYDETALSHLAGTRAAYVGLVASRRRAAAVRTALQDAGVDQAFRSRIVSPAGLDLSAETPQEIAVSILAQIIQARRTSTPRELALSPAPKERAMERDVVCGMSVDPESPLRATHAGRTFLFCSEGCRTRFLKSPEVFANSDPPGEPA